MANFEDLVGKTILQIKGSAGDEELVFVCSDGTKYKMLHHQVCCESVYLSDIAGDLEHLIGAPVLMAYESSNEEVEEIEERTWTFYNIATKKGYVSLRWLGESNGFYSEEVSFELVRGGG